MKKVTLTSLLIVLLVLLSSFSLAYAQEPVAPTPIATVDPIETPDGTREPMPTPDGTREPMPTPDGTWEPMPGFAWGIGVVSAYSDTSVTIVSPLGESMTFALTPDTEVEGILAEGAYVVIEGFLGAGTFVANDVEVQMSPDEDQFVDGIIEEITDSTIVIGGQTFNLNPSTEISGTTGTELPQVGDFAYVTGEIDGDGQLWAVHVEMEDAPVDGEYVVAEGIIESYGNGEIVVDGQTFVVSDTTKIEGVAVVGQIAFVAGSADANGVVTAEFIGVHLTSMPYTGEDNLTHLSGVITDIDAENHILVINERIVALTDQTEVHGDLAIGAEVDVLATINAEGQLTALSIDVDGHELEAPDQEPHHLINISGPVVVISETEITIDGHPFEVMTDTEIEGGELVNDAHATVVGETTPDGLVAFHIEIMDLLDDPHDDHEGTMGKVTAIGTDFIAVNGREFLLDSTTNMPTAPVVGDMVYVTLHDRTVVYVEIIQPHDQENQDLPLVPPTTLYTETTEIMDVVSVVGDGTLEIDGETVLLDQDSNVVGQLTEGEPAYVIATRPNSNEPWVADFVEALSNQEGQIDDINHSEVTINGQVHVVDQNTRVLGDITPGMRVRVGMSKATARGVTAVNTYIQPLTSVPTAVSLSESSTSTRDTMFVLSLLAMGSVLTISIFRFGRQSSNN